MTTSFELVSSITKIRPLGYLGKDRISLFTVEPTSVVAHFDVDVTRYLPRNPPVQLGHFEGSRHLELPKAAYILSETATSLQRTNAYYSAGIKGFFFVSTRGLLHRPSFPNLIPTRAYARLDHFGQMNACAPVYQVDSWPEDPAEAFTQAYINYWGAYFNSDFYFGLPVALAGMDTKHWRAKQGVTPYVDFLDRWQDEGLTTQMKRRLLNRSTTYLPLKSIDDISFDEGF